MIRLESQHFLSFPREAVWLVLSRTDWINRSVGLPPVSYEFTRNAEGGSTIQARARMLGMDMRWQELPFEWLEPEFYRVHRLYDSGPFKEGFFGMDLHAESEHRTRAVFFAEVEPRNGFTRWIAEHVIGPKTARDMGRIIAQTEDFLSGQAAVPIPKLPVHPVNENAFAAGLEKLRASGQPLDLTERLVNLLRDSPDVSVSHMRPLAVARQWKRDPWEVLGLFLHATRAGLLDLSWEVLCPNCRSTTQPVASLSGLRRAAHCDVCQIEYNAEFDRSVELKFAVNPAIRPPDTQTFCLAGPAGKPHVLSQLALAAGEERAWKLPLRRGPLRLRSPQVQRPLTIEADETLRSLVCEAGQFVVERGATDEPGIVRARNPNTFPVLLALEQIGWSDDVLTASRVTNWQDFRDLFSSEVISPTERITVGSQVVLFTDLRGSTAMYRGLGDAPAYALVRDHFSVLAEATRAHRGAIVKTIGDAVMATFSHVDEALDAVRRMHAKIPSVRSTDGVPLALKSSLHVGPCLAVNANDRLDYFGTTINLAARMVECSRGGDLVVSDELFQRPEMRAFLQTAPFSPEQSEVHFRGFDAAHRVWRIAMV